MGSRWFGVPAEFLIDSQLVQWIILFKMKFTNNTLFTFVLVLTLFGYLTSMSLIKNPDNKNIDELYEYYKNIKNYATDKQKSEIIDC